MVLNKLNKHNLLSNVTDNSNDKTNFVHKLLTDRQVSRLRKLF